MRRSFSLSFYHPIHPFQQGQELGVTQAAFDHCARTSRGKLSRFQTLAPQAVTTVFKRQHLDVGLPPIDKGKPVPAQRVFAQLLPHPRRQAIERAAHIGRLRAQPDAPSRGHTQHAARRRRRNTPSPSSSSISQAGDNARLGGSSSTNRACVGVDDRAASGVGPCCRKRRRHQAKVLSATPWRAQNCWRVSALLEYRPIRACHSLALRRVGATPARRVEIIAVMVLAPRGSG